MRFVSLLSLLCVAALPALTPANAQTGGQRYWAMDAGPLSGTGKLIAKAGNLVAQGRYAEADPILSDLYGRTDSRQVRFLLGMTSLGQGNAEAARRYFLQSLSVSRMGHPGAMSGLAVAEARLGNMDSAHAMLTRLKQQQAHCASRCLNSAALDRAVLVTEQLLS